MCQQRRVLIIFFLIILEYVKLKETCKKIIMLLVHREVRVYVELEDYM